jgi:anti-anti-sigma factor
VTAIDLTEPFLAYTHLIGGAAVVRLCGDLDAGNAADLYRTVGSAASSRPNLVIDLRSVTEIDEAGIDVLSECHRHVTETAGMLCLAAPSREHRALLASVPAEIFDHADAALMWLAKN